MKPPAGSLVVRCPLNEAFVSGGTPPPQGGAAGAGRASLSLRTRPGRGGPRHFPRPPFPKVAEKTERTAPVANSGVAVTENVSKMFGQCSVFFYAFQMAMPGSTLRLSDFRGLARTDWWDCWNAGLGVVREDAARRALGPLRVPAPAVCPPRVRCAASWGTLLVPFGRMAVGRAASYQDPGPTTGPCTAPRR